MLGSYDFCGHYEMTFQWLEAQGGRVLLEEYWIEAISKDSQLHARELILAKGFEGMLEYWGHTLAEESPDRAYTINRANHLVRIDMHDCPSKGFLIRNGLVHYNDYCDHCIGWIAPMMRDAGFIVDHEHNHCGQCWWEFRESGVLEPAPKPDKSPEFNDVRLSTTWKQSDTAIDTFRKSAKA